MLSSRSGIKPEQSTRGEGILFLGGIAATSYATNYCCVIKSVIKKPVIKKFKRRKAMRDSKAVFRQQI